MSVAFERRTRIAATREQVFDLSLDVDFHLASFKNSGEQIVDGVVSGGMRLGDDVTWRARHFGIWWKMQTQITEYDRPQRFVDEQVHGPFKSFRHVHTFTEQPDGDTEMVDQIEFSAPLGILGTIADRLVLGRYIPHLIDVRNRELVERVER